MIQYAETIDKSTLIREILVVLPDAASLFMRYGIHCASCTFNAAETLGDGIARHRMTKETQENLFNDLRLLCSELPPRPPSISVTKEAAIVLKRLTSESGTPPQCIMIVDEQQQLTLEVRPASPDDHTFFHPDMPDVRIAVSPFLLAHAGGAEISVKNGRLTIDLPKQECCASPASCTCKEKIAT